MTIKASESTKEFLGPDRWAFIESLPEAQRPNIIVTSEDLKTPFFDEILDQSGYGIRFEIRLEDKLSGKTQSPAAAYYKSDMMALKFTKTTPDFIENRLGLKEGSFQGTSYNIDPRDIDMAIIFHEAIHLEKHASNKIPKPQKEFEAQRGLQELYTKAYEQGVVQTAPKEMFAFLHDVDTLRAPILMTGNDSPHFLTALVYQNYEIEPDTHTLETWENEFLYYGEKIALKAFEAANPSAGSQIITYANEVSLTGDQKDLLQGLREASGLTEEDVLKYFTKNGGLTEEQQTAMKASIGNAYFDRFPDLQYKVISKMLENDEFQNSEQVKCVMEKFIETAQTQAPETFIETANLNSEPGIQIPAPAVKG